MKIKIDCLKPEQNRLFVRFIGSFGTGVGVWKSNSIPTVGKEYSVELDIEKSMDELEFERVKNSAIGIWEIGKKVKMTGILDGVDPDGMCYLRISNDCLIMIDTEELQIDNGEIITIFVPVGELEITAQ